ncbi:unnamed protein product [Rotaria socialis]|uniref:Uncharacterized protein n=1 Tax=Rotaria socialis TaxID=392032 RepID=A0A817YT80_9BILA|nr:unnamed protein product [Rotaria socialis]
MAKVQPELPLDAVQLSETAIPIESTSLSPPKSPRQLPKHLADFKHYVDSKCCYHSVALDSAELADVQPKAAYRCQMKTLMESRDLDWTKKAASWQHETVLFSETLGRAFEDTKRPGRPVGDIWDDYTFDLPSSDSKSTDERPLPECSYLTRCSDCRGKGLVQCQNYECKGSGKITCTRCYGEGKVRTIDYIEYCNCSSGKINCPDCKGGGKIHCSNCKGYGGFRHSVTLRVKWHTCITTLYYQNSFLPEKRMEKAQRVLYWANTQLPWSQNSSIDNFLLSLREDEAHENINLKANLTKQYREKHMKPTSRGSERMRRLICTIERLDFEEVHYTLDEKYVNKRDSTLGYFPFSKSGNAIELAVEICQGPSLELTIARLSHHCKEFVNTCLNKDENQRPAYEQLFENPFVQQANEVSQAQHFVSYCSNMIDLVDKTTDTFDQYGFRP